MIEIINSNILEFNTDKKYHAIISDPPYGLAFMNKGWDSFKTPKQYQEWVTEWSSKLLNNLYPGAICAFFGGTRTYHRLASGLEDAGYEIFDSMIWCYGSGFPKSYNISKGIDKSLGLEREIVGYSQKRSNSIHNGGQTIGIDDKITKPNSNLATTWNGYGTALKPAYEPIVLCRKPLSKGGYVNSVLEYGTSGLNIDGGRIETDENLEIIRNDNNNIDTQNQGWGFKRVNRENIGRFPANFGLICTCGQEPCECVESDLDRQSGISKSNASGYDYSDSVNDNPSKLTKNIKSGVHFADKGGASRFFYTAKASSKERELGLEDSEIINGLELSGGGGVNHPKADAYQARKSDRLNSHPTVKPIKLIEYLATLLLPPIDNSSILIPFSGVGSEMIGSYYAGWHNITGIEIDENYVNIANKRLEYWTKFDNYSDAISNKVLIDKETIV